MKRTVKHTYPHEELIKVFDSCHKQGATTFGTPWLKAHLAVVKAIESTGIDASNDLVKTIAAITVLAVMRALIDPPKEVK